MLGKCCERSSDDNTRIKVGEEHMPMNTTAGHGRLSKREGSFYTPDAIANAIVRLSGIMDLAVPSSHVMDPAAGDGALLVPVLLALAKTFKASGMDATAIAKHLVDALHAIELDATEATRCRENLSAACQSLGMSVDIDRWDVTVGDTCAEWERFQGKMDFVLMNPPYVRIHNLSDKPESPYVMGMCDLYYAFFDYAQRMLSPNGRLALIAPSSWMTAKAGSAMREDLHERGAIQAVCDYGHLQVFAPYATTYTALVLIGTSQSSRIAIWSHDESGNLTTSTDVSPVDCWHNGYFLPSAPRDMGDMLNVPIGANGIAVKNGYATNLDRFFISKGKRFSAYEIPVVKASRADRMYAVYPYDANGSLVPFDDIREADESLVQAFENNRDALLARTQVDPSKWWCYARTQGIADTYRDKVAIQSLVLPPTPPRTEEAPSGTGVFGGIYVTGMTKDEVDEATSSEGFFDYVKALRKYKSGGYYAYGGRDLERFLSWWKAQRA